MTNRTVVATDRAPPAIGAYSQAVRVGTTVYLAGQIPLHPDSMDIVEGGFDAQVKRVFENLRAVAQAAGGGLGDTVKLNVYLVDLGNFAIVNEVMAQYFSEPYPARAAIQVAALPKGVQVEIDGVLELGG